MTEFDVVVVGAGPAGSATAREISRKGVRVLVLEEHTQIGVPVHCAGLITSRTFKLAEVSPDITLNRIKGAHVHSPTGSVLTLGGDRERALVIDRAGLDRELADQAQECGATFILGTRVVGIERVNGRVRLHMQRNGHRSHLDTHLVIGADGTRSVVAGRNGGYKPSNMAALLGAEVEVDGLDEDFTHVYMGSDVAPGWFGWLVPVDDRHARIGVGTSQVGKDLHKLLSNLIATRKELRGARIIRSRGGLIPLAPPRRPWGDNFLLVGDAAGQVKPTSGGGLYPLLVAARLCAKAAFNALGKGDFSHGTLENYRRDWDSALGSEFAREYLLRRFFVSLTAKEMDAIFDVLGQDGFERLVSRYGDIDQQSGLFSRLFSVGLTRGTLLALPKSLWPKFAWLGARWGVRGIRDGLDALWDGVRFRS
jgi:geranylgeranyl reductase family protein